MYTLIQCKPHSPYQLDTDLPNLKVVLKSTMVMGSKSPYLLLFLITFAPCLVLANPWSHSSSSSSYIHSNDTFTLELAENQDLHGAPGSFHRLKFL